MTKNEVRAKVELMTNLAAELAKLQDSIVEHTGNSQIYELLNHVRMTAESSPSRIMSLLEEYGYFKDAGITEEGETVLVPTISINKDYISDIEASLPLGDKGRLTAYTNLSDSGTYQTGTMYYDKDDFPVDLTLSEIKKSELAETHGMDKDNRDIEMYLWTDPCGNFAMRHRMTYEDIVVALEPEQETERE